LGRLTAPFVAALLVAAPAIAQDASSASDGRAAALAAEARTQAGSGAACADEIAARVQDYYDSVRDFAADFEQTTHSVGFASALPGSAAPARGQMILAKPGKMRWSYTHPEASLVVSDGTTLWLYSPGLAEAQRLPVIRGYLNGAALQFLLGDGKLLEAFRISASGCGGDSRVELDLEPREPASYERLGLTVLAETGEVVATGIVDLFGNRTQISFEQVRRNQDPSPELFRFEPGPEVEVIDMGGS
jgi:outer membrane lipoprotein carrier protein